MKKLLGKYISGEALNSLFRQRSSVPFFSATGGQERSYVQKLKGNFAATNAVPVQSEKHDAVPALFCWVLEPGCC